MNYGSKLKNRSDIKVVRKENALKKRTVFLATAIAVLILLVSILVLFTSPLFKIQNIKITGNSLYPENDILSEVEVLKGRNALSSLVRQNSLNTFGMFFKGRYAKLENKILFDYPCFETAEIFISSRNTITIEVSERNASIVFNKFDDLIFVDAKGFVTRIADKASVEESSMDKKIIKVQGLDIGEYKLAEKIAEYEDNDIFNALRLCSSLNENAILSGKVEKAIFAKDGSVILSCPPSLMVEFGEIDNTVYDKILRLSSIFARGYDENSEGTIVLNTGGYDVFRKNKVDEPNSGDGTVVIPPISGDLNN